MSNETPTDALRLVPTVPTPDMLNAAVDATDAGSGMSWSNRSPQSLFQAGYEAMLAAAPASPLPEGGGWQDISTAPKDGTVILTYGSLHNDGAPYGIGEKPTVKISQYSAEGEFWCCDAWGSHEPVWWMPLPAAPTGEPK